MEKTTSAGSSGRRDFLKEGLAALVGGVLALVPGLSGLAVFFDPLRRHAKQTGSLRVAALASVPEDGSPAKFAVVADKSDAWNKLTDVPIGAVYLRRVAGGKVQALNVVCPHAGCFVTYQKEHKDYLCPCHDSRFALDGSISSKNSPSFRGLDSLDVDVVDGQVFVKFLNFQAGKKEKIPVS